MAGLMGWAQTALFLATLVFSPKTVAQYTNVTWEVACGCGWDITMTDYGPADHSPSPGISDH